MSALAVSNVVLWVLVLALSAVVLALTRQLGVLHQRIAPAGALMLNRGLTVGEPAPVLELAALDGRELRVGLARDDGRSTLLLFVSPSCPVCKSLLPAVKSSRRDERSWMDVILASDGDSAAQREFVRDLGHAEEIKKELERLNVRLSSRAGNSGRLFGAVTVADIATAVSKAGGPSLDKRKIEIPTPIKTVGSHKVSVRLHPEVAATIGLTITAA